MLKRFFVKYKPELLISVGISGLIMSSILNVDATAKAVKLIESEKKKLKRELTLKEKIKLCWKKYIPSTIMIGASVPCIVASNSVNSKRNAALAAAYTVAETSLKTFKEETAKTMSEEKFKELEEKVAQKKVDNTYSKAVIIAGDGDTLFYDEYSGRYFKSNWNTLQKIANELNAKAIAGGDTITLEEWYNEIGLSTIVNADIIGWDVFNGTKGLIDISLSSCVSPDNQPCGVIHYNNEPKPFFA